MDDIVNTVQFRFPVGNPRPTWTEIASFVKQLDTDLQTMETAYRTAHDRSIFIKFTSLEAMRESMKNNTEPRVFQYSSGKTVAVRMVEAGSNVQYIRLFDLPPELTDETISLALGEYGKVKQMVREKFSAHLGLPHMYTGVRGIYMDVEKDIPSEITIRGRKGRIYHDGLQDTCFLCKAVGHKKDSCPQRQPRSYVEMKKQQKSQPASYAAAVSGQVVSAAEQVSNVLSEEDIIEVLEEDIVEQETDMSEVEVDESKSADQEKEKRRQEGIATLHEVAKAITEAVSKQQASQRRAQFATSGSKEHSRPKKLCARKTFY